MILKCLLISLSLALLLCEGASFYPTGAVRALHSELTSLQSPRDCAAVHTLVLVYSAEDSVNGFAAMFQFAAGALAVARALNRTLIEVLPPRGAALGAGGVGADPWLRAPARACGGLKLGCFLEPMSHCALEGGDVRTLIEVAPTLRGALAQSGIKSLRISSLGAAHALLHSATRGDGEGAPVWWAAAVGTGGCVYEGARSDPRACSRRLFFPLIQAWAFRPLARIIAIADATATRVMRERAAEGGAVWGIHVRLGDAAKLGWRTAAPLSEYLALATFGASAEARRVARNGAPARAQPLFIATDSASTRATAASVIFSTVPALTFDLLQSPASILSTLDGNDAHAHIETYLRDALEREASASISVSAANGGGDDVPVSTTIPTRITSTDYLPPSFAARLLNVTSQIIISSDNTLPAAAESALRLTEGIILDIWTLSHSTHFVGTCLSQVSRTAYELAYAWGRARAPPVGLDVRACRTRTPHFVAIEADWRDGFDVWADDEGGADDNI
jgi:hypothetical protein